ncbi:hypothetical protein EDB83DRAFT_2373616, partial [Lactarius deliciosus]
GDRGLVTFLLFVVFFVNHIHRLLCHLLRLLPTRSRAASPRPVVLKRNLQHVHEFHRVRIVPCPRFPLAAVWRWRVRDRCLTGI